MVLARIYTRTDRNGTKIYEATHRCPKCNGTGYISNYKHVQAGVCFDCNGDGFISRTEKEYTPEYAAKLQAKAAAKEAKKAEKAAQWLSKFNGVVRVIISQDGGPIDNNAWSWLSNCAECIYRGGMLVTTTGNRLIYAQDVVGNTKFAWIDVPVESCARVEGSEVVWNDLRGIAEGWAFPKCPEHLRDGSDFQFNIGDKVDVSLRFDEQHWFSGTYGESSIVTMTDENGNTYKWFTAKETGWTGYKNVRAVVKDHKLYLGKKETILTRCKVA